MAPSQLEAVLAPLRDDRRRESIAEVLAGRCCGNPIATLIASIIIDAAIRNIDDVIRKHESHHG